MKFIFILLFCLAGLLAYYGFNFYQKFSVAQKLIAKAEPYELKTGSVGKTMLVLGDSTAVGVGADGPQDTVPALLSSKIGLSIVDNQAVSGARVFDIDAQASRAPEDSYDLLLVMIGANDIIRFASADDAAATLKSSLAKLPPHEQLVVVLSAGNVGGTKLFPWFVRPFHSKLNQKYHQTFSKVVEEVGGEYVNLYEDPRSDPFVKEPDQYLAKDGLHPTSLGYGVWLTKILEQTDLLPKGD